MNPMTTTGMQVRAVRGSDFEEWELLWRGYNTFYGRSGETALRPEITSMTWSRFFDAQEPMHALVAEQDGRLLGLAHFLYHRSTIQVAPTCYLQDVFTCEASRGQGVACKLIEQVYRLAMEAGSARVYWHTHETNTTAMRLYDKIAEKPGFLVYRKSL